MAFHFFLGGNFKHGDIQDSHIDELTNENLQELFKIKV